MVDDPAITETELVSALPGVVLIFVADVGIAEPPGSAGAFAGICGDYSSERVFPVDVNVASHAPLSPGASETNNKAGISTCTSLLATAWFVRTASAGLRWRRPRRSIEKLAKSRKRSRLSFPCKLWPPRPRTIFPAARTG